MYIHFSFNIQIDICMGSSAKGTAEVMCSIRDKIDE